MGCLALAGVRLVDFEVVVRRGEVDGDEEEDGVLGPASDVAVDDPSNS